MASLPPAALLHRRLRRLRQLLPPPIDTLLGTLQRLCHETDSNLYLAGGAVRDLLLGRRPGDLDLVVEGDAIALAGEMGRRAAIQTTVHPRFGTARLQAGPGLYLDLARSRREVYARPGALPAIRPATIGEDLGRRDISINAMALALHLHHEGGFLDPWRGHRDLAAGVIRLLHSRSLQDDPTRAFRALRYAARLGFRLAAGTRRQVADAVRQGWLAQLTPARLGHEILALGGEKEFARALEFAAAAGVLTAIHPDLPGIRALRAASPLRRILHREGGADSQGPLLTLALLLHGLPARSRAAGRGRMELPRSLGRELGQLLQATARVERAMALATPPDDAGLRQLGTDAGFLAMVLVECLYRGAPSASRLRRWRLHLAPARQGRSPGAPGCRMPRLPPHSPQGTGGRGRS